MAETVTILVVDDEELTRELLALTLREAGYTVQEASTGLEALQQIIHGRPAAVLLDVMLPGMDGFEVLREVRRGAPPRPHIWLMSAHWGTNATSARLLGAAGFFPKPFVDVLGVAQTIAEALTAAGREA